MKETLQNYLKETLSPVQRRFLRIQKGNAKRVFSSLFAYDHILPEFIIIGACKAGTSFLYDVLGKHPSVKKAVKKEVKYFSDNYDKGINWYRSYFPISKEEASRIKNGKEVIMGEASPIYICHPLVPKRLYDTLPGIKLIALLRDPVERAYSQYQHAVRVKHETRSFEEAVEGDIEWLENTGLDNFEKVEHKNWISGWCSYVARGIYVIQLKRWMEYFPKERFLILKSEDMNEEPFRTYDKVVDFLALPGFELKEPAHDNKGSYSSLGKGTKERLKDYFRPYNEQLYEFLGVNFGWDQ